MNPKLKSSDLVELSAEREELLGRAFKDGVLQSIRDIVNEDRREHFSYGRYIFYAVRGHYLFIASTQTVYPPPKITIHRVSAYYLAEALKNISDHKGVFPILLKNGTQICHAAFTENPNRFFTDPEYFVSRGYWMAEVLEFGGVVQGTMLDRLEAQRQKEQMSLKERLTAFERVADNGIQKN